MKILKPYNQQGQIVIILLLVMVIALGIGLSIVGRTNTEISTATKTENSSRAFSAAEAGIEQLLQRNPPLGSNGGLTPTPFLNQALAKEISWAGDFTNLPGRALEYPAFGKESFAQFWLVDPTNITTAFYQQSSFNIYFGDPQPNGDPNYYKNKPDDKPAVEVNVISWNGSKYTTTRDTIDSYSGVAQGRSSFRGCDTLNPSEIATNDTGNTTFYCQASITGYPDPSDAPPGFPLMVRVRILYSDISHPVALQPVNSSSLPPQAKILNSKGVSGNAQRNLRVFQEKSVMPYIFDYALFTASELNK